MRNTSNSQIEAFRTSVAGRLDIDDPSNEAILRALDRKLGASEVPSRSAAARAPLSIEDDRLYDSAWPAQRPDDHQAADLSTNDQLYVQAWGSIKKRGI